MNIKAKQLEARIFNLKGWIELIAPQELVIFFQDKLEEAEFTILNYTSNEFPHNGFTAVWVLAESHLALHSFADSGWTYFELTSCNKLKSKHFKKGVLSSSFSIKLDLNYIEESSLKNE